MVGLDVVTAPDAAPLPDSNASVGDHLRAAALAVEAWERVADRAAATGRYHVAEAARDLAAHAPVIFLGLAEDRLLRRLSST